MFVTFWLQSIEGILCDCNKIACSRILLTTRAAASDELNHNCLTSGAIDNE